MAEKEESEKIKDKMDEAFRDNQKTKSIQKTLNQYFNDFIEDIEKGNRLTDSGKKYEKGTVKSLRGTLTQFEDFQKEKKRQYNFDDINIDVHEEFMNFFNDKNYSLNTIGRHIKNLKTIMRNSKEEGLHNNTEFERRAFRAHKTEVTNIYLDEKELAELFDLDLSNKIEWDLARDVFLIGCYTGLRYSDYSRINKDHITEENGNKYIDIITKKTGERVIIPMRREVEEILNKYDYNIPRTHEQKINKHIKKIGEKAGIEEMIEVESIKGGLKVNTKVPKHDLIKTHTARRSAATNMYLAGIPSIDIMKITGHTKESSFLKYICITKDQTASNLADHEYFNNNLKIAK